MWSRLPAAMPNKPQPNKPQPNKPQPNKPQPNKPHNNSHNADALFRLGDDGLDGREPGDDR